MVDINDIYKIGETLKLFSLPNEKVNKPFGLNTGYQLMLFEATNSNLDSFNIFLSAYWIDNKDNHQLLKDLYKYLRENLLAEINQAVNAVFFVDTSDKTVQYFNTLYNYNNQPITFLASFQIGDNLIENAYLLNPKMLKKVAA